MLKVTCLQSATVYRLYRRRQAAYGDVEGDLSAVRNSLPFVPFEIYFKYRKNYFMSFQPCIMLGMVTLPFSVQYLPLVSVQCLQAC